MGVGVVGTALAASLSDASGAAFALSNHVVGMLFILFRVVGAGVGVVVTQKPGRWPARRVPTRWRCAALGASTWVGGARGPGCRAGGTAAAALAQRTARGAAAGLAAAVVAGPGHAAGRLERVDGQRDACPPACPRHTGGDAGHARHPPEPGRAADVGPGRLARPGPARLCAGPAGRRARWAWCCTCGCGATAWACARGFRLVAAAPCRAGGDGPHRPARGGREHRLPPVLHGQRGGGRLAGHTGAGHAGLCAAVHPCSCCCLAWPQG
jgi:hypothetical protein